MIIKNGKPVAAGYSSDRDKFVRPSAADYIARKAVVSREYIVSGAGPGAPPWGEAAAPCLLSGTDTNRPHVAATAVSR